MIPCAAHFEPVLVWVSGEGVEASYNPATGAFENGLAPIFGKTVWLPGVEDSPTVRWSGHNDASKLELRLNIDAKGDKWTGRGVVIASGALCPFDKMEGIGTESADFLEELVSSVLPSAELKSYNLSVFDRFNVTAGIAFSMPAPSPDSFDRQVLVVGSADKGVNSTIDSDVLLYEQDRGAPVTLRGTLSENIIITLNVNDDALVVIPANINLTNTSGTFSLNSESSEGKVTYSRELKLSQSHVKAKEWAEFRSLLLEHEDRTNASIYLK